MLKASENFKLVKTFIREDETQSIKFLNVKYPYFLIQFKEKEYISHEYKFFENTSHKRKEFLDAYKEKSLDLSLFLDSKPVSGWEEIKDGSGCFLGCKLPVGVWDIDLPNMIRARSMFFECQSLQSFNVPLPSLTEGDYMFKGCKNLTSFNVPIPILVVGKCMFKGSGLEYFSTPTPCLKSRQGMFENTPFEASSKSSLKTKIA